jgi:MYXO-CTERM domain-containing protein
MEMRKAIAGTMLAASLTLGPVAVAGAQSDPNDVESVDNPVDQNDDNSGFDDWGLFGLLGLLGLAGLAKRNHRHDDVRTTRAVDPDYAARR